MSNVALTHYDQQLNVIPAKGGGNRFRSGAWGKGWSARMLCSETCGCNNPGGEFINVQGCPYLDGECRHVDTFAEYQSSSSRGNIETIFLQFPILADILDSNAPANIVNTHTHTHEPIMCHVHKLWFLQTAWFWAPRRYWNSTCFLQNLSDVFASSKWRLLEVGSV